MRSQVLWIGLGLGLSLSLSACAAPAPEQPETSTPETAIVETNQITYSDSGFSPATIKIQKGETVIFTNESGRGMQPASNVHPTHQEYPSNTDSSCDASDFDACTGVATYQFTFTEVGEWEYHNHLRPTDTGSIVVE